MDMVKRKGTYERKELVTVRVEITDPDVFTEPIELLRFVFAGVFHKCKRWLM